MNEDNKRQIVLEEEKMVYKEIMNSYCVFEKRKRYDFLKELWKIN